jgi:hypothetical protein
VSADLVVVPAAGATIVEWAEAAEAAWQLAQRLVWTDIVPAGFRATSQMSPQMVNQVTGNCAAALMWGAELSLPPMAALRSIYVIKGQPAMYTKAIVGLAQGRGHRIWTELETDDQVTVAGHRDGDPDHVERVTYTLARARAEGLTRNENYRTRPRHMLWARAAGDVARRIAADILMGVPDDSADDLAQPAAPRAARAPIQRASGPRQLSAADAAPALDSNQEPTPLSGAAAAARHDQPADELTPPGPEAGGQSPDEVSDIGPVEEDAGGDSTGLVEGNAEPAVEYITKAQQNHMHALFNAAGLGKEHRDARLAYTRDVIGREIETSNALTVAEASAVIDALVWDVEHKDKS